MYRCELRKDDRLLVRRNGRPVRSGRLGFVLLVQREHGCRDVVLKPPLLRVGVATTRALTAGAAALTTATLATALLHLLAAATAALTSRSANAAGPATLRAARLQILLRQAAELLTRR